MKPKRKVIGATGLAVLGLAVIEIVALAGGHLSPQLASAITTILAGSGGYLTPDG